MTVFVSQDKLLCFESASSSRRVVDRKLPIIDNDRFYKKIIYIVNKLMMTSLFQHRTVGEHQEGYPLPSFPSRRENIHIISWKKRA
jgi:hypothetical protein